VFDVVGQDVPHATIWDPLWVNSHWFFVDLLLTASTVALPRFLAGTADIAAVIVAGTITTAADKHMANEKWGLNILQCQNPCTTT